MLIFAKRKSRQALGLITYQCYGASGILSLLNFNTMTSNMGSTDKIIRIIIAILVAALYFSGTISGTLGLVLLALAAVFVLTSLVSFCPLYTLFGINTCSVKEK